mmetsp:Transcript_15415/g.50989  ORF Transcript_15415/g.50989 Transcript_15415/m.50989 type:complete len:250 (-) Transcript_15415:97-846(-)
MPLPGAHPLNSESLCQRGTGETRGACGWVCAGRQRAAGACSRISLDLNLAAPAREPSATRAEPPASDAFATDGRADSAGADGRACAAAVRSCTTRGSILLRLGAPWWVARSPSHPPSCTRASPEGLSSRCRRPLPADESRSAATASINSPSRSRPRQARRKVGADGADAGRIVKIVLTGGPCGGKSSCLRMCGKRIPPSSVARPNVPQHGVRVVFAADVPPANTETPGLLYLHRSADFFSVHATVICDL